MSHTVAVTGGNSRLPPDELQSAARWMLDYLLPGEDTWSVIASRDLKRHWADVQFVRRNVFVVRLARRLPDWRQLTYLAHELVHVKQVVRGELSVETATIRDWELGEWEVEAVRRERVIYQEWLVHREGVGPLLGGVAGTHQLPMLSYMPALRERS
jgi:hypothetical protein